MGEFKCQKCLRIFGTQEHLNKHMQRKFPCDQGAYKCKKCSRKFQHDTTRYQHQKNCAGKTSSHEDKDRRISELQTAIAAASGLKTNIQEKEQTTNQTNIQNNNLTNCHIGDVNNIQININVLPLGKENVEHLKHLSLNELRQKIGLRPEASTMIELFKLVRLDSEHPENHNLLLTSKDSDRIHYFDQDGWKEGDFNECMRNALLDDKLRLRDLIGIKHRDETFYWGYLEHHVGQKINEKDHIALKPIYDGTREPLLQSTLKLAVQHDEKAIELSGEAITDIDHDGAQHTLRANYQQELNIREIEAKNRAKELELEILKLKLAANIALT